LSNHFFNIFQKIGKWSRIGWCYRFWAREADCVVAPQSSATGWCQFIDFGRGSWLCRSPLCFSRFYPAYFGDRYRSRTGRISEN